MPAVLASPSRTYCPLICIVTGDLPQKSPVQPIWRTVGHIPAGAPPRHGGFRKLYDRRRSRGERRPKGPKPGPPAAECDAIDRISQFQLGSPPVSDMRVAFGFSSVISI